MPDPTPDAPRTSGQAGNLGPRLPRGLTTPRFSLRQWSVSDVDLLAGAITASIDHLRPWMPWVADEPLDPGARRAVIESFGRDWAAGGDVVYGIFEQGRVVGGTGLHRRRGPDVLEIGYWVHVDHVRRGIATEVSRALTDASFDVPGIERVQIHHDRANAASAAVPAHLGFTLVREAPNERRAPAEEGVDCTWSVTAAQWRARRPQA